MWDKQISFAPDKNWYVKFWDISLWLLSISEDEAIKFINDENSKYPNFSKDLRFANYNGWVKIHIEDVFLFVDRVLKYKKINKK